MTEVFVEHAPETSDGSELIIRIKLGGEDFAVRLAAAGVRLRASADVGLLTAFLPAMRRGEPLRVRGPVSPRLLAAMPQIQRMIHGWKPQFRLIEIHAETSPDAAPEGRSATAFFSAGADSFYTVLTHLPELTALTSFQSFMGRPGGAHHDALILHGIRAAAAEMAKPLIEIRTDVHEFCRERAAWDLLHGAFMSAVASALADRFHRAYIAVSYSYNQLIPWGSHPDLDPLYSTEAVEIVHDAADTDRVDRFRYLIDHETAMRHLQVCNEAQALYNCGKCSKCVMAKAYLHAWGADDRCRSLPGPLEVRDIDVISGATAFPAPAVRALEVIRSRGGDPEFERALERRVQRWHDDNPTTLWGRLRKWLRLRFARRH